MSSTTWDPGTRWSYVRTILREGTSADRQLQVFRETGDLRAVVRFVVDETRRGVEADESPITTANHDSGVTADREGA